MGRWLLAILVTASGCTTKETGAVADAWVGRWNGPEGTYLEITGAAGAYEITIKDLDAARTFNAVAAGNRIEFRRDGAAESIRATNGDATGMKWLAGKTN